LSGGIIRPLTRVARAGGSTLAVGRRRRDDADHSRPWRSCDILHEWGGAASVPPSPAGEKLTSGG
jgi:hypothetical protein